MTTNIASETGHICPILGADARHCCEWAVIVVVS